jgi:polar amino acid transport system permease protein
MIVILIIYFFYTFSGDPSYDVIWGAVADGIEVTIRVSIEAYAIALVLGLIIALMRRSTNIVIYQLSTFYVELIRGIPTLILVLYFAVAFTPEFVEWLNNFGRLIDSANHVYLWAYNIQIDHFNIGPYLTERSIRDKFFDNRYRVEAALAISYSAFLSEVFRAGLDSVEIGQIEAAKSLGLSRFQTMRLIILPQAFRVILPPLGNDFIAILKESSLVSVVGVEDITRRGRTIATSTFRVLETYNIVALTYLVLTLVLALCVRGIETLMKPESLRYRQWISKGIEIILLPISIPWRYAEERGWIR